MHFLDVEFAGSDIHDFRFPSRNDADDNTASLRHFDTMTVTNVEGLELVPQAVQENFPIRQHAIDIKQKESDLFYFSSEAVSCVFHVLLDDSDAVSKRGDA
jgi:hypothetical protein